MTAYYYLAIAICAEVIATVSMKAVKGLSTPLPLVLVILGYGIAFWMLTLVVRSVPVGVAYAVWAGMGIVMVSVLFSVLAVLFSVVIRSTIVLVESPIRNEYEAHPYRAAVVARVEFSSVLSACSTASSSVCSTQPICPTRKILPVRLPWPPASTWRPPSRSAWSATWRPAGSCCCPAGCS